ncbi:MAG: pyridoxamine 5'-phosphate oxidase family protein [Synergistaceae bacterium]|jgi:general stress protein 26|nr:pyridoxamine 5'-phosphate oxidase family protein [Synergistaceae bacterium]
MKSEEINHKDAKAKAEKLLAESKLVFMGTNGSHGHPNVRALVPMKFEDVRTIWFATDLHSSKILELIKNNRAVVYAFSQKSMTECRFWGAVTILEDAASRKHVWTDELKKHFEGGVDDPRLRVLRFDISNGVYGSNKDGKSGSFTN